MIRTLKILGTSLLHKIKSKYRHITTAFRVSGKRLPNMQKIGTIKYHGDMATVEVRLPKYLAEWIEKQSSMDKVSPSLFIKTWIQQIYNRHAEKITGR